MKNLILLIIIVLSINAHAKLLDKIAGVINDQVYTLSEIQRIQDTIEARREISPMIYTQKKYTSFEILKLLQRNFIIKDKLTAMGFVMSDDNVESRILDTERRLGLTRQDLLNFLKSKNITFNEYFELIREAMELNVFNSRVIAPLVSITEPEIKNYYYKVFSNKRNTLSFKYYVLDFFLPENRIIKDDIKRMPQILAEYQKTGNIPSIYKNIETNDLGNLTDEDLPKELSSILKQTQEGNFSQAYIKNGMVHIFFLKKKDMTESNDYLEKKEMLHNQLFVEKSKSIFESWFGKESKNYFIQENI